MIQANEYYRIHQWLIAEYGRASKCESGVCTCQNPKRFEWALIKGKKHDRNRDNYMQLCPSCHRKYDYTEEQREKQSNAHKGKIISIKHRERLSASLKGVGNKPIVQMMKDGTFVALHESVSIAAEKTGVLQTSISNVLTNRAKTSGGFIWQYRQMN